MSVDMRSTLHASLITRVQKASAEATRRANRTHMSETRGTSAIVRVNGRSRSAVETVGGVGVMSSTRLAGSTRRAAVDTKTRSSYRPIQTADACMGTLRGYAYIVADTHFDTATDTVSVEKPPPYPWKNDCNPQDTSVAASSK